MKPLIPLLLAWAMTPAAAADRLVTSFPTLSTEAAANVAQAALAACRKQGYVVTVAVVDRGGSPLALLRDNLAGPHTPNTAIGKAWTAVSFRTNSSELQAMTEPGRPAAGIRNLPNVVSVGGGLVIQAKGALVGAVGVSGAPSGALDESCGGAGIAAIQETLELE